MPQIQWVACLTCDESNVDDECIGIATCIMVVTGFILLFTHQASSTLGSRPVSRRPKKNCGLAAVDVAKPPAKTKFG